MRIISFSNMWNKLDNDVFTTFRYPRADKDWYVGERVQVFYKNRSPNRQKLGEAIITNKELRNLKLVTNEEAIADGFDNRTSMEEYMHKQYGVNYASTMNKITFRWINRDR